MWIQRRKEYSIKIIENNVTDSVSLKKTVPDRYIGEDANDVTSDFITYSRPLIIGEPRINTKNRIPKHILYKKALE